MGDIEAHYQLSVMYSEGEGGVDKDQKKETYIWKRLRLVGMHSQDTILDAQI